MTLDEILIDLYLQIHTADDARDLVDEIMWREINAHVAAEREACAQIVERNAAACDNHAMLRDVLMSNAAAIHRQKISKCCAGA